MARSGCLILAFLPFFGTSCLLYTDEINHPPEVVLTGDAQTTFMVRPRPKYHAAARDADQSAESLTYEWHRQLGACPSSPAMAGAPVVPSSPDFENDLDFASDFCVFVVVRDQLGATAWAATSTQVKHQPTMAKIDVVKPTATKDDHYPLLSLIQLSGAGSKDPEKGGPLQLDWKVKRNTQDVDLVDCPEPSDTDICFLGDQEGAYTAALAVTDARGTGDTAMKTVTIDPDAPPCILRTEPMYGLARIVRDATEENTFEVKAVSDDVDPFPALPTRASNLSFEITWWHMGEDPGSPSGRRATGQGDQMPIATFTPGYFKNGDQVFVRIKAIDRVDRTADFMSCASDKADCAIDKSRLTCFQWVTWMIDFRPLREM